MADPQIEIDIGLTQIKIHTAFTISDGTNSSVFLPEYMNPVNPFNTPNVFASTDAKTTTTGLSWRDIEISSTGQYQIAVVNAGNVWISSNYGEMWLEKLVGGGVQSWRYAMISGDGSTMMARADGQILWKSTDYGTTWTSMPWNSAESTTYYSDVIPMKLAYDGNHMCSAIMTNTNTSQATYSLTLSTDGGVNWSTVSNTDGRIDTLSMSKSGQYIVIIYGGNTTKPKYSDDYGVTFITLTNGHTYSQSSNGRNANSMATISNTGKLWHRYWRDAGWSPNAVLWGIDVNTGTVTNGENDAALTVYSLDRPTAAGTGHSLNSSNDGKYIIYTGYEQWGQPRPQVMYISTDYGVSFTNFDSTSPLYKSATNMPSTEGAIRGCRFSDDNKYVAVVQQNYHIYIKNTFLTTEVYTPTTFAAKLTTDLGYTVTAGGDLTITDTTPYYRLYLQFANAVTLTGMPKYIFNIPFSDFSVKAGGQVNFRNVSLDAAMVIATSYNTTSNTSTIPAGNYFINNFVSTIETDLVNYTLSYDEPNKRITFDSLAQDISMSITSSDTTIFDTSITEITTGANILPFITYGQPDPTIKNYSDNGITVSEFISNGYTIPQLLTGSVIPVWNYETDANHFDQSYVKGFTDVSGSVVIRNDNRLITNGELSLGGNLTINPNPPVVTNHLLSSTYLAEQGYAPAGQTIGIIPSAMYGSGSATWTYPLELTNVSINSLDEITVNSANRVGEFAGWTPLLWTVVYKYEIDHLGNPVDGHWIFGGGGSTATSAAVIAFTLNGTTPSVEWKRMNAVDTQTSALGNGDFTSTAADLARVINDTTLNSLTSQAWKQISNYYAVTDLAFATTNDQPQGTTSLVIDDMTLKSQLFMGEDISANGNVYVGGDLSVNGQFSGDFANNSIPQSAIIFNPINISGKAIFKDDVSFNGPTVDVNMPPLITTTLIPNSEFSAPEFLLPTSLETAYVLSNVSINSLDEIEIVSSSMDGTAINSPTSAAVYKYPEDPNGTALEGNWVLGIYDGGYTKSAKLVFTLNGTTPSIQQIGLCYYQGVNLTTSAADLISLYNDSNYNANYRETNYGYQATGFTYRTTIPQKFQVNQIEFNDGTTMTTHDDNILSGTFADSNVIFKDSTFAAITCEGTATAATVTQSSDYRIKENVTELNEMDTVDALVPIQYNNTVSGNHEFGLLAHELQEIYPDLVNGEKDGDEYQEVHYNGLIGVLVKEVQDLKQRLAVLNNR